MNTDKNMRAGAIKLTELFVIFGVSVLVLFVSLTYIQRGREVSNRIKCADNLRKLGDAILHYANDNNGQYVRTRFKPTNQTQPTWGTRAWASDPFSDDGPEPNDVTAALFLLVRLNYVRSDTFICPSTKQTPWDMGGRKASQLSNWPRDLIGRHLSYSFANSYLSNDTLESARLSSFRLVNTLSSEVAIMADMNPGVVPGRSDVTAISSTSSSKSMKLGNSLNHDREGQNVLYADGHVEWQQNAFVGVQRDNIYVRRAASTGFSAAPLPIARPPYDANDTVLLPCAE